MLQVEYIESKGTQYIDTGFKPNNNTCIEIQVMLPTSQAGKPTRFFDTRNTTSGFTGSFGLLSFDDSNKILQARYNERNDFSNQQLATETLYTLKFDKGSVYVNGTLLGSASASTFQCDYNLPLMALSYPNHIGEEATGIYRLYYCKIYDNGTLVRDFIPVLDDNGVACLYEQVESQLYYNQGTGLFAHPQPTDMTLIFDRTNNDVKLGRLKGQHNAFDLNRVEHWCRYLADELNAVGYNIQITTKVTWQQTDKRTAAEMERIRKNIQKIMEGYHWITKIYANAESFNYVKANNWEKILYEIHSLMYGMQNMYVYGGVARGGEPLLWQNNFMHLYNG